MVSFRGRVEFRTYLNAASYGASNVKISLISTTVKNSRNWAGSLKSVGGSTAVISYVVVGSLDVAEWLQSPAGERDISDLMAVLFVDFTKIGIATVAASIMGAVVIGAGAPVWIAVVGGIAAGVAVGVLLDVLDVEWDISNKVIAIFDEAGDALDQYMTKIRDGLNNFARERMTTDPLLVEMATGMPPNAVAQVMGLPSADYNVVYDNDTINAITDYLVRNRPN